MTDKREPDANENPFRRPTTQPTDNTGLIERCFSEDLVAQARRLAVHALHDGTESPGTWRDRVRKAALAAALATKDAEIAAAREALKLAQPIVEADYQAAKEQSDADWEGMSFEALEAINSALGAKP